MDPRSTQDPWSLADWKCGTTPKSSSESQCANHEQSLQCAETETYAQL